MTLSERFSRIEQSMDRVIERQRLIDEQVFLIKGEMKNYPEHLSTKLQAAIKEIEMNYFERLKDLEHEVKDLKKQIRHPGD